MVTRKKTKLLLATPSYHCGVVEVAGRWLPLNLLYIASAARKAGMEVVIYDAMSLFHRKRDIRKVLRREKPDYLGLTSITATVPAVLEFAGIAKDECPDIVIFAGGVHPTFMAEELADDSGGNIDFIIRGEGEETTYELLVALRNGDDPGSVHGLSFRDTETGEWVDTPSRSFLADLDAYPAAFDLADWSLYKYFVIPRSTLGAVSTSRGCNHSCTFCSQQKFWNKSWRYREPRAVAEEIENIHRRYGVNVILVSDEYPTNDAARWEEILDRIIALKLPIHILIETRAEDIVRDERILPKYRKAGIVHVYVGLEATDQETLDLINKELTTDVSKTCLELIRANGMLSETSFVLGFPNETKETVQRTLQLAKSYNPDMAHFLFITPWPYADLWGEMKDRVRTRDYSKYNLIEPVVEPHAMTLRDLDLAVIKCYKDFYMRKFKEVQDFPDVFRRRYMLDSMKLIMTSSFLAGKMAKLAIPIPEAMKKRK